MAKKEFKKWYSWTRVHFQTVSEVYVIIKDLVLIYLLSIHFHWSCSLRGQDGRQVAKCA